MVWIQFQRALQVACRIVARADQGLYAAKEAGRNQVQCIDWSEVGELVVDA